MTVPNYDALRARRIARLSLLPFKPAGQPHSARETLIETYRFRVLIKRITVREIKARYKDSVFGALWVLVPSIVQLAIYYFAIGRVLGASRSVPDFAVFVFTGLTFWAFFSEAVSSITGSLIANSGLIKKVYLPREIFPIAALGSAVFSFLVQLLVLVIATFFIGNWHYSSDLLYVPLAFSVLIVFASAIGLVLSAATVYFRDLQHLLTIALTVLFWASPIVYPYTFIAHTLGGTFWNELYLANPITLSIIGAQKGLWVDGTLATGQFTQEWPADLFLRLVVTLIVGVAFLVISHRTFRNLQSNLAQEL